jgi:PAS domain S-box-containing protein
VNADSPTSQHPDRFDSIDANAEIIESLPVATLVFGRSGDIHVANSEARRMLGYSAEEIQGLSVSDLLPAGQGGLLHGYLGSFWDKPEGRPTAESPDIRLRTKDGSETWVQLGINPTRLNGELYALVAMVDAGDWRRTTEALHRDRRAIATLIDNLPGMAYRCLNDERWTIEFASRGCLELTGYGAEDLVGGRAVSYHEMIIPEDLERIRREVEAALRSGGSFDLTYRIATRDGTVKWVSERGRAVESAGGDVQVLEGFIYDVTHRVQAEKERSESERTLRAILDHAFEYIGLLDTRGRMIRANQTSLRVAGVRMEDVKGRLFWETPWWAHSAEEQARLRAAVAKAAAGEFVRFETTHPTSDGRVLDIDFSLRPVIDETGAVAALIPEGRDITDQKVMERALRESEEKFFKVFRASPDAISVSELATGRFIDVNDGFERISGYRRDALIGRTSPEIGIWADTGDRRRMIEELEKRGSIRDMEVKARSRSGASGTFLLSADKVELGGRTCVIIVSRDITERLSAEQALRESEEKFSKAFRVSPFALTISELATGRYIDVNSGFERTTGYSRPEVIGRTSKELGIWVDLADRDRLIRRLRSEGSVREMEISFRRRDGAVITTLSSCELLEIRGVPCLLNTIEDVTERRRIEREKLQLEGQLRQSQKLEALGTLAGGIAHDFNNILTGIVIFRELAMMDLDKPDEARKHLAEMKQATNRAKELVRQILSFSRNQVQERKPVRLHPVIAEALKLLRSSLPATIEMSQEIDEQAPEVLADTGQVHQVLMNLVTNAAQAMRGGAGRLTVHLGLRQVDEDFCSSHPTLRPGTYAQLTVADTGQGMDEQTQARIFEPFFTTKAPGEGTGLGLAVVRGIMEDHDGAIFVRSRVDAGTTFDLFFPQHLGAAASADKPRVSVPRGRGESVLLVDDEPALCRAVGAMLQRLGYDVTSATDPVDAVRRFSQSPASFDLVITDNTMPRMTGLDVIREVHALRPRLPALMMSGLSTTWTPERLHSLGVGELVAKPVDHAGLAQAVHRALGGEGASR